MITLLSWTVGWFFILARFRFFWDPSKPRGQRWLNEARQEHLTQRMCKCGLTHYPRAFAWFVALCECSGGVLILIPATRLLGALLLLGILIKATICTARAKVCEQNPVDAIDYVSCYLWRVEGLYIVMVISILGGALQ